MTQRLRPLLALAIVALIGAGCSDTPAETGSNTSTTTNTNAGGRDKAGAHSRRIGEPHSRLDYGLPS